MNHDTQEYLFNDPCSKCGKPSSGKIVAEAGLRRVNEGDRAIFYAPDGRWAFSVFTKGILCRRHAGPKGPYDSLPL